MDGLFEDFQRGAANARDVADLAGLLRHLRRRQAHRTGTSLGYREMAARNGWSRGIIGEYLGGRVLPPTDRFDALVQLLGADRAERQALAVARDRIEEQRWSQAAEPAALPEVPRQLPLPMRGFTGREGSLAALDSMLDGVGSEVPQIAVVSGAAGVGKTALAVHWAYRVADQFPDGQVYVNLRGFDPIGHPVDAGEVLHLFFRAFEVPARQVPDGLDAQVGLFRGLLADRRVLVLLDNAYDADQVHHLLPGGGGCLVIVTSRAPLAGLVGREGVRPFRLNLLTADESCALLAERLGAQRLASEPQPVHDIVARCAGLPLALAVVAARATVDPRSSLTALAASLREGPGLDGFGIDDPASNVRSVFSWSYRRLSRPAADLFRLLAVHCGPDIAGPAVASLAGLPPGRHRALLDELVRVHLIAEHTPGRYTFHDLLRAYAVELAERHESPRRRRAALHRALDHYLHTAFAAAVLVYRYRDPITLTPHGPSVRPESLADEKQARAWFTAEHSILRGLIDLAQQQGFDRHAWQLAWTLVDYYQWQGAWGLWTGTQRAALAAATRLGDRHARAMALQGLARPLLRTGDHREARAHLLEAQRLFQELGDAVGEAYTLFGLCSLAERAGHHQQALWHALRCLDLLGPDRHPAGRAIALNNVGWYHCLLGEYRPGLGYCEQALALVRELGDRHAEANTLDSIGLAHHHLAQYPPAVDALRRAADLFAELGDRDSSAATLVRLGETQHAAGETGAACHTWRRALAVLDELGRPEAATVRARLTAAG